MTRGTILENSAHDSRFTIFFPSSRRSDIDISGSGSAWCSAVTSWRRNERKLCCQQQLATVNPKPRKITMSHQSYVCSRIILISSNWGLKQLILNDPLSECSPRSRISKMCDTTHLHGDSSTTWPGSYVFGHQESTTKST